MLYQLKCCDRCKGDLVFDRDEWHCWQCGRYYYPKVDGLMPPPEIVEADAPEAMSSRRRHRKLHIGPRKRNAKKL